MALLDTLKKMSPSFAWTFEVCSWILRFHQQVMGNRDKAQTIIEAAVEKDKVGKY